MNVQEGHLIVKHNPERITINLQQLHQCVYADKRKLATAWLSIAVGLAIMFFGAELYQCFQPLKQRQVLINNYASWVITLQQSTTVLPFVTQRAIAVVKSSILSSVKNGRNKSLHSKLLLGDVMRKMAAFTNAEIVKAPAIQSYTSKRKIIVSHKVIYFIKSDSQQSQGRAKNGNIVIVDTVRRDSLHAILQPARTDLNEIIVMNYGLHARPTDKAEPLMGWQAYHNYLDHASSPDAKTGFVKVSFVVNPNGSLTGFTIVNGLSAVANQTAINLIKQGPGWKGSATGKPETVNLKLRFR